MRLLHFSQYKSIKFIMILSMRTILSPIMGYLTNLKKYYITSLLVGIDHSTGMIETTTPLPHFE
ncbi:putative secreted protein [Paenibacillus castaneae]|nr:putative secreted protein [Paenibacillus castaneae]